MNDPSTNSGAAAIADTKVDVLDTPIRELIRCSHVSVRLHNATMKADNVLPFETVRAYIEAGPEARDLFLNVPNLGRKSVNELDQLIRDFVDNMPPGTLARLHAPQNQMPPPSETLRAALLDLFSEQRFPDALFEGVLSTRLEGALRTASNLSCAMPDFLNDVSGMCQTLHKSKNFGRKSTTELTSVTREFAANALETSGFSPDLNASATSLIFDHQAPSEAMVAALTSLVEAAPKVLTAKYVAHDTVVELIASAMSKLSSRNRDILERRYGFDTGTSETLEEVGASYRLTRERIRQLESKAMRTIKRSNTAKALRAAFAAEIADRFKEATDGAGYLKEAHVVETVRRLPAAHRLALDLLYDDRSKCLRAHAERWHKGWIFPPYEQATLDEQLCRLKSHLATGRLPCALTELLPDSSAETVAVCIELGTDLAVFQGYVCAGRIGPRARRTIGLHRYLAERGGVAEIADLTAQYRQLTPSDNQSSVRDAMIVMLLAPHLFLGVSDRNWCAIGKAGHALPRPAVTEPYQINDYDEPRSEKRDEAGIRAVLRAVLSKKGPLRFVELRDRAALKLQGKSVNSIGPILVTSGEFVRPLPGIYGLPEQVPPSSVLMTDPPAFLLSEDQVRYLAEARYAREPFGLYPMWCPEAEYALCRWSHAACDAVAFQSLLAVASIDLWPVAEQERNHWRALKEKHGCYGLASAPKYPIRQLWPPLDRVLAACVAARETGGLSWISANRVLKRRLDAHVAPGVLALLVAIGALEPPLHWQMFHKAGPRLAEFIQLLSLVLHEQGQLTWSSSAGQELIAVLHAARDRRLGGWVEPDVIDELVVAAEQNTDTALPAASEADESSSSLDDLLREVAEAQQSEEARRTLHSVMGQTS